MPTLLTAPPETAPALPRPKLWTRDECEKLAATGLLDWENYELIEGELFSTMGKNRPHVIAVRMLMVMLGEIFGALHVESESGIEVASLDGRMNAPEPDVAVLTQETNTIRATPSPAYVRLVAEVSDSTLAFDLGVKARLYARAGIPEYWVVDIQGRRMVVHREPVKDTYNSIVSYGETESVSPLAAPDHTIPVARLF